MRQRLGSVSASLAEQFRLLDFAEIRTCPGDIQPWRRDERERSLSTRSPPQDEDLEALCEVGMLQRICVSQAMP